jgi:cell division septation protein DedD
MMRWVSIVCCAAALVWTAVSFVAYSDLVLAFRTSLVGWLIYGAVWVAGRVNFAILGKPAELSRKQTAPNRHRLAVAGAAVAIVVLAVLTVQWLGKKDKGGDEDPSIALKSEPEPAPTKQEPPAEEPPKTERTVTQKAAGLWTIQVAAFKSEQAAVKLAKVLKNRGWETYVTSADVNAVTVYRTNVGRFRTREAAEKLLLKLKDKEAYTTAFVLTI